MVERTYIVAVDAADPSANSMALRHAVEDNPDVSEWWNHIPCVYLVTTLLGADELSASFYTRSRIEKFLVMEVNMGESEGLLPDQAWRWIQRRSPGANSALGGSRQPG